MEIKAVGNKPVILIAEDHLVNQKLLSLILDRLGYPSIMANDGQEALEKAETANNVALVFMDIQMPVMDGYEAAENLRKRGFKNPIIAVTASALPDEWEHCREVGIDDMLVKPYKLADVDQILRKWINTGGDAENAPEIKLDNAPSDSAPDKVFSSAVMLDTFMNNEEIVLPLLARFISRTQVQLENIPNLENAGDWEKARRDAHTIRGTALTMGGAELGKAAARLELAYKNIDRNEMEAAYPPLNEAFGRFKKEAEEYIRSRS